MMRKAVMKQPVRSHPGFRERQSQAESCRTGISPAFHFGAGYLYPGRPVIPPRAGFLSEFGWYRGAFYSLVPVLWDGDFLF